MKNAIQDSSKPSMPAIFSNFIYEENLETTILNGYRTRFFQKFTANSCQLFLRGKDNISVSPQIFGIHEPVLTKLIDSFAAGGYSDFLLDIGANIGLTSCQNGKGFSEVHMFEPNPLCYRILEVNAAITLDSGRFTIHPFGLGDCDKTVKLTVPKHNWGGAFINDAVNAYDSATLAAKDSFKSLDKDNYFDIEITIKNAATELQRLFGELSANNLLCGVIKIDVEGYEPVILKGIAEAIPQHMKCLIVFESWNADLDIEAILSAFDGRASAYKLALNTPWKKHWLKPIKLFSLLFNRKLETRIEKANAGRCKGDIILKID